MRSITTLSNGSLYLEQISKAIAAGTSTPANTRQLNTIWNAHLHQARQRLPEADIHAKGQILHTGELSPGCRACKAGAWDCVFITDQCNLKCPFCTLPNGAAPGWHGAAYGRTPETFIENIARAQKPLQGVGFTGGEALLNPRRLYPWISAVKKARPDLYLWVYTNGIPATPRRLRHLRKIGVDEIRFNMAATGYNHPQVMAHLAHAAHLFETATVEIPAIPEHAAKLRSALSLWAAAGAKYLNLHELMREPHSPSKQLEGDFFTWTTADGHTTDFHRQSRPTVLKIMEFVTKEEIPLGVNDCSSHSKQRQILGRRHQILPLVKQSFEKLKHDHFLSHVCAISANNTAHLIHPDKLAEWRQSSSDYHLYEVQRTIPLNISAPDHWTKLVEIGHKK